MKAVRKFKSLVEKKRPLGIQEALSRGKRHFHLDGTVPPPLFQSKSDDTYDRKNLESVLNAEGVHLKRGFGVGGELVASPEEEFPPDLGGRYAKPSREKEHVDLATHHEHPDEQSSSQGEKGHAHDPLSEPPLFLGIGAGEDLADEGVAESPTAAEFSIYDTAYREEVERIREAQGREATVYLNRRVDGKNEYKGDGNMIHKSEVVEGLLGAAGLRGALDKVKEKADEKQEFVKAEVRERREERGRKKDGDYLPPPGMGKVDGEGDVPMHDATTGLENKPLGKQAFSQPKLEQANPEDPKEVEKEKERKREKGMRRFSEVAAKAVANTKALGEKGGETVDRVIKKVGISRSGKGGGGDDGKAS